MIRPRTIAPLAAALLPLATALPAQEAPPSPPPAASPAGAPLRLDLSRRDLKNFLVDAESTAPFRDAEGKLADLRDVFTLGAIEAPFAVFWDARSCRLVGILDLGAPPEVPRGEGEPAEPSASPYVLKADGPHPLAGAPGASERPDYFGFRLVEGRPEFLYRSGLLSVEERIWLEDRGGLSLRQRFSISGATRDLRITVPATWEGRVEASAGSWKGKVLTVPKDAAAELVLTYPLSPAASENAKGAGNTESPGTAPTSPEPN